MSSSVGIATELRDRRSGDRIPVRARFFAPVQPGPGVNPTFCTRVPGISRGRKRPECEADSSPLLVPRSKNKSRAIPVLSLRAFVACKKGETYLLTIIIKFMQELKLKLSNFSIQCA
jgi:hypothetical protein